MLLAFEHLVSPDSAELVACSPDEQSLPRDITIQPGFSLQPLHAEVQSAMQSESATAAASEQSSAAAVEAPDPSD